MFGIRINPELLKQLREIYPAGARVEVVSLCDPYRDMPADLKGTVLHVDDAGGIHVNWDNGSTLAALHGIDRIRRCD